MRELIEELGAEKVVLGVDAKDGLVAVEGWEKVSTLTSTELCAMMKEYGVRHIYIRTFPETECFPAQCGSYQKAYRETGLDVIASGGVSCIEDLKPFIRQEFAGQFTGKISLRKQD